MNQFNYGMQSQSEDPQVKILSSFFYSQDQFQLHSFQSNSNTANLTSNNLRLHNLTTFAKPNNLRPIGRAPSPHAFIPHNISNVSFNTFKDYNFNTEEKLCITGNIFEKRKDWSIISKLPLNKQNTIHFRCKDEGPYGNDEIRCFLLAHLSSLKIKQVNCVLCECDLVVYDRFPLIDGTFFVSPSNYGVKKSIPTKYGDKNQFLYGICLKCLSSNSTACKLCDQPWNGSSLQIGTFYKYDVIAAFPCCQYRLNCQCCNYSLMSIDAAKEKYFSSFSEDSECPRCHITAGHFLKPLESIFKKAI